MKQNTSDLLDQLITQIEGKEDFDQIRDQLFKRGVESLLNAEMTAHLGHLPNTSASGTNIRNGYSQKSIKTEQGIHRIKVPRDRAGSFDPLTIPKHKTMSQTIEDCIQLLYAKGMSTVDITEFIEQTYGIQYSSSQVSVITNQLLDDIKEWQNRPLEDQYAVVWIDAIHYKIRHEGKVISKAGMIVLGINMEGKQDILSIYIVETESATSWSTILDDLKGRGVKDILILCSDNLTGLQKAVEALFPNTVHQICIVHQIRNSLKYVSYKDRKKIVSHLKEIYRASNEEAARLAFEQFKDTWNHKYPLAVQSWERNWDHLTAFLVYPAEVRSLIYTTNIIESFNASLRKYTKNKKVFPTDEAALKSIYLAAQQIRKKWQKTRYNWGQIYNQIYIFFENRILQ